VTRLGDAIGTGTRDQAFDALVSSLFFSFVEEKYDGIMVADLSKGMHIAK
jgi:hypothetical protein